MISIVRATFTAQKLQLYIKQFTSDQSHSYACSRSEGNDLDHPLRILVIHPHPEALASISKSFAKEDVPHIAIVGSGDKPKELLQAIYRAGVHDLHEFLFVQSLVSLLVSIRLL
jgi:hypothetical protein